MKKCKPTQKEKALEKGKVPKFSIGECVWIVEMLPHEVSIGFINRAVARLALITGIRERITGWQYELDYSTTRAVQNGKIERVEIQNNWYLEDSLAATREAALLKIL